MNTFSNISSQQILCYAISHKYMARAASRILTPVEWFGLAARSPFVVLFSSDSPLKGIRRKVGTKCQIELKPFLQFHVHIWSH